MTSPDEFVCLPRALAEAPPIRHHHSDPQSADVTPFEFGILSGVLTVARRLVLGAQRHEAALATGAKAIELEKALDDEWREEWKQEKQRRRLQGGKKYTPQRRHAFSTWEITDTAKDRYNSRKPMPLKQSLRRAGHDNYEAHQKAQRRELAPEVITVETSRYSLLRYARLSDDGANLRKVEAALDRLCETVGTMPVPLLQSWQYSESGYLELQISGSWLNPRFVKLPLPLPLRSPTVLAILLLLKTISLKEGKIPFERLCRVVGIPTRFGQQVMSRAMNNALHILNRYLESNDAALPADYIQLVTLGGYVGFRAVERPQIVTEDADDDEVESAETESAEQQDDEERQDDEVESDEEPYDEVESADDVESDDEIEPSLTQMKINAAKAARSQLETKPRPGGPRPRAPLLSDEERQRNARIKDYRNYLTDLLGHDGVAKLSDDEVEDKVNGMYDMPNDQRRQMERDLRHETERQARLAMYHTMREE
jgi:hypothetical protein